MELSRRLAQKPAEWILRVGVVTQLVVCQAFCRIAFRRLLRDPFSYFRIHVFTSSHLFHLGGFCATHLRIMRFVISWLSVRSIRQGSARLICDSLRAK